jgi:hypothetical protein
LQLSEKDFIVIGHDSLRDWSLSKKRKLEQSKECRNSEMPSW